MASKKFSTRSALAFVLPSELQGPVQSIRKIHDKAYDRWPPHINFFFPFIPEEQIHTVVPQLRDALARIQPFTTVLDTIGSFKHGKGPLTIWLGPQNIEPFVEIFNAVSPLFPDLNNNGREVFVPHMTLGQCKSGPAYDAAAAEFKGIIGSIECLVDSIQVLVRDADTPFASLYTIYLGGREPELHPGVANRGNNPAAVNEDDALMADADAAAAVAENQPSVSMLLKNKNSGAPHTFAELLGAKPSAEAAPSEPVKKEEPLVHFFDDTMDSNRSVIAVDTSGSTSGSILKWSIKAVRDSVESFGPSRQARENILQRAISWNDTACFCSVDRMRSGGCTYPCSIIPLLPETTRNLLITTDGEIYSADVNKLRTALQKSHLTNVIAFIVGGRSALERRPCDIEMSVFFPLMEHCMEKGGTFMLFFVTKESDLHRPEKKAMREVEDCKLETRLMLKCQNERCSQYSQFVNPPAQYDKTTTWDQVPVVKLDALSSLLVEDNPEGTPSSVCAASQEHAMVIPGIEDRVDLVEVARTLSTMRGQPAKNMFQSVGMDQFICDVLPKLVSDGKVGSAELAAYLRDIVQKWQRLNLMRIEIETENAQLTAMLEKFRALTEQRIQDDTPALRAELARISDEMRPLLEARSAARNYFNSIIRSVASNIMEGLSQIGVDEENKEAAMLPEAFTLDAVTSKMANRTRRAKIVSPTNLSFAEEAEKQWDLTNAPPVCNECLVCMRDNVPAAMLAVDISKDHTNVLALNVSDVGIDDALTTGLWNTVAFPAGNFCVSCAFACAALGQHPMTRQPVSAVIPCVDLSIKSNRNMMHNSLCNVFYGGKSLPSAYLVFFGALSALKREQRFPDELIDAFQNNILHNTSCNMLPETSPLGKTEVMIDAMRRAVCLPIDRMNPESWLVSLRNRSIPSVSIMTTTVFANDPSNEVLKSSLCMVRRQFMKTVVTAVLNAGKRNPVNLKKMRNAIEHDLFENIANCPMAGSQRLSSATSCNILKVLFSPRNYQNLMTGMTRVLSALKVPSLDELITPSAFSSFLAYIYENVTRAPISASQRKVEDFLSSCFTPTSAARGTLLSDAFFDGAVTASGGDAAALAVVLDSAPFKLCLNSIRKTEQCNHNVVPCFAKSHLYSPPVTHCAICGHPFLNQKEISSLMNRSCSYSARLDHAQELVELVKTRRSKHFAEVFGTKVDSSLPCSSSSTVSLHESVRFACSRPEFKDLKVPTRELVLAVLARILDRADPGCPYKPTMLNHIVLCACDFLNQRALWAQSGREAPGDILMSMKERLIKEIDDNDVSGINVTTDCGLDPELLKQLTAPVVFDPAAENVALKSPKDSDDES